MIRDPRLVYEIHSYKQIFEHKSRCCASCQLRRQLPRGIQSDHPLPDGQSWGLLALAEVLSPVGLVPEPLDLPAAGLLGALRYVEAVRRPLEKHNAVPDGF